MKKIGLFLILLSAITAEAQFVSIPDTNFRNWLQQHFPACMNGNQMDTTCTAITSATTLDISVGLYLTDLDGIQYFDNLKSLNCSGNELTQIQHLPPLLEELDCESNFITTISFLPNSLKSLTCSYNPLTSFPSLPPGIVTLNCVENQLTQLQLSSFSFLKNLDCTNNPFVTFPDLPASLATLKCGMLPFSTLPALPPALESLLPV